MTRRNVQVSSEPDIIAAKDSAVAEPIEVLIEAYCGYANRGAPNTVTNVTTKPTATT